jgi:PAS domain S-box-containing protein
MTRIEAQATSTRVAGRHTPAAGGAARPERTARSRAAALVSPGVRLTPEALTALDAAFAHLSDTVVVLSPIRDTDGRIVDERIEVTNPAWREIVLGRRDAPDPAGASLLERFPGLANRFALHAEVIETGVAYRAVMPTLFEGAERWFDTSYEPFGEGVIAISRDVTESHLAYAEAVERERLLRETTDSELRFQVAMDNAAVGMAVVSPDGRYIEVNATLCAMLGRDADSLRASTWQEVTHPDDLEGSRHKSRDVLAGRRNAYRELKRYIRPDGTLVWGELSTACVRNDDGSVRFFVSQIMDVTERIAADERLRASEERYRNLVDELDVIVTVRDLDTGEVFISRQVEDILGYPADGMAVPGAWLDKVVEDDRARVAAMRDGADGADAFELGYRMHRADGSIAWLEERWRSVKGGDGSPARWFAVTADVTARKRMEETVARTDRLEAVSRVSAAAAHDFGNVLIGIQYFAGCLTDSLGPGDPRATDVAAISDAVAEGIALTRQLLAFGRDRPQAEPAPLDVAWLLTDLAPILRGVAGNTPIDIDVPIGSLTRISRNALEQALLNLVINARDATPADGSIRVFAREEIVPADSGLGVEPGQYIGITVADTGSGMTPEVLAHAFEPFFTTKAHGTGTGLASTWGSVRAVGGTVRVSSAVGVGTTVCVLLPIATL